MSNILDGTHLFQKGRPDYSVLEDRLEYYRNFLLLYAGLDKNEKFYITFSQDLESDDEFVDIFCPHCGYRLNEHTMHNEQVWVHSKQNVNGDLEDRATWGIVETLCPDCKEKTVIILE